MLDSGDMAQFGRSPRRSWRALRSQSSRRPPSRRPSRTVRQKQIGAWAIGLVGFVVVVAALSRSSAGAPPFTFDPSALGSSDTTAPLSDPLTTLEADTIGADPIPDDDSSATDTAGRSRPAGSTTPVAAPPPGPGAGLAAPASPVAAESATADSTTPTTPTTTVTAAATTTTTTPTATTSTTTPLDLFTLPPLPPTTIPSVGR